MASLFKSQKLSISRDCFIPFLPRASEGWQEVMFSQVSVHSQLRGGTPSSWRGYPSQVWIGGTPSQIWMGVPNLSSGWGVPHPRSGLGEYPVPGPDGKYPILRRGVPLSKIKMGVLQVPHQGLDGVYLSRLDGVPPPPTAVQDWMGYPSPRLKGVNPPPPSGDRSA